MSPFRRRRLEAVPDDPVQPAPAEEEQELIRPEQVSPRAAEALAKSLGQLAESGTFTPDVEEDILSAQQTWAQRAAEEPDATQEQPEVDSQT